MQDIAVSSRPRRAPEWDWSALEVNRDAQKLFGADDKADLIAHADDLSGTSQIDEMAVVWAAFLAGERTASYEDAGVSLDGRRLQVLETVTLAPGSEDTWERIYLDDVDITPLKDAQTRLEESLARLQTMTEEVIRAIGAIVEVRDPYTAGHERRVSELVTAIAKQMGFDEESVSGMAVGALLHDVGKISVPAEILSKPGRLNDREFDLVKSHPQVTHDLLSGIEFPWPVAEMALQHHERMDGSGYPLGLAGDEIAMEARILAVSDVVEAMASHRPYRPALGVDAALEEIGDQRGTLYDPSVVDACVRIFREQGFSFE